MPRTAICLLAAAALAAGCGENEQPKPKPQAHKAATQPRSATGPFRGPASPIDQPVVEPKR